MYISRIGKRYLFENAIRTLTDQEDLRGRKVNEYHINIYMFSYI